jgi:hypothetical protein
MRSFRKSSLMVLCAALGISLTAAEPKAAKADKADKADKGDKADGGAAKTPKGGKGKKVEEPKEKDELELPIPKGQTQKSVNVPLRRPDGKMDMNFHIGTATKVDDDNVKLQELKVQTYKEDGKTVDLDMDLPDAIYNKVTKMITSEVAVKIVRADFEIVGQNMAFQVKDHTGVLGGGVKMIIYDRDSTIEPDKKTKVEFKLPPKSPPGATAPPATPSAPPPKKDNQ